MTEQDEIELYNEGYRDGLRAARINSEVKAMYVLMNQQGKYLATPGGSLTRDQALARRFRKWADAFDARTFGFRIVEVMTVTETPFSDFEHVTL